MNQATKRNPQDWVGRKLGKYEVTQLLGEGENGLVLRAHDVSIERDVAIKVLNDQISSDELERARFFSGAKSAGSFNHANIVTVHEVGQEDGYSYLVMEIVTGGSAREHLDQKGAYPVGDATRMVIEASKGLAAAHERGFVHRDVSPANLLLTDSGMVKVSDFRLAKQTAVQTDRHLTLAGQIVGTTHFMSPEQCQSEAVDARSDIYSLGATYYCLLTGKRPYEDKGNDLQVMLAHIDADPPNPTEANPEVPDACAQIIEQAMAKQPDQRYESMEEMRCDLEAMSEAMAWGYA